MKPRLPIIGKLFLVSFFLFITLLSIHLLPLTTGGVAFAAHPPPTPTPAPTPPPGVPWLLENYTQQTCLVQGRIPVEMVTYYGIWVNGKWKKPLNVTMTNVPAGTQVWSLQTPIPPGSSDGIGSLADEAIQIPSNTALGTYTLSLVATDGKLQQSVPVTLKVQTRCGRY